MNQLMWVAVAAAVVSGCATTSAPTSWGKANVSKRDYGTDIGMCTGLAAQAGSGSGSNTAGGLQGQNSSAPAKSAEGSASSGAGGAASSNSNAGAAVPTGGGGVYRDSAPQDVVNRAATQQQAQVMAAKRAKADTYRSCLTERGYSEFRLTPEQQAHLQSLKAGSNEYHEYLYSLGKDPAVLQSQAAPK
jgi:hypothetical protein